MRAIITTSSDDHVGLAVIRSLGKNNIKFHVVSPTKKTLCGYSKYSKDKSFSQIDLELFLKYSKDDIIFPMWEDTMLLLSKNKSKLQCTLGFSDYQILQKVTDKSLLIQHALEQNIPCPRSFFITTPEDIKHCLSMINFPTILKPNRGTGGKGIQKVESPFLLPEIAEEFLSKNGPFLIQEKIPYTTKYTVGALCNFKHEIKSICIIKELRNYPIETGPACYVETVNEPELVELTEKLLKSLDYFGIANIDFLVDDRDKQLKLMEINPRFWGSMQVALNAGVDFPHLLFKMIVEDDIETSISYKIGIRCRYVIFRELFRLILLMKIDYPLKEKRKALQDFLRFRKNEGFFVFCSDDIMPFFGLIIITLSKKLRKHL